MKQYVYGLDIGTRSIVGTVGYKEENQKFKVVYQVVKEHKTRAMVDGQIHDIKAVSDSIRFVTKELESMSNLSLKQVCIAAAGRVLKTATVQSELVFDVETVVNSDLIHSLELLGIEKAYESIKTKGNDEKTKFYCVGYSVVKYYLNDYIMLQLEGHKATKIAADVLATFLPEDVIDGLYAAVELAGLKVANLTLEPIAAIRVAIPQQYRLLNLALVDIGAGTSDICITKDGAITSYGMIPLAGDEITEEIARTYLVDFETAEKMKIGCFKRKVISFKDIMGISHKVSATEILASVEVVIKQITERIAEKIKELNGGKPVSAVFLVGGGGKVSGFSKEIANQLGLMHERVALKEQDVFQEVEFEQTGIKKDSLLVTPIGICLTYYDQKNNFIFVSVNSNTIKLYNKDKLTILDAAVQINLSREDLFPKRSEPLFYYVNGEKRMQRGQLGEAAIIRKNGAVAGLNDSIEADDIIEIIPSTKGEAVGVTIGEIKECQKKINVMFNGKLLSLPPYVTVNHQFVTQGYKVSLDDRIEVLNYYPLNKLLEYLDLPYQEGIEINHVYASESDYVYENSSVLYEETKQEEEVRLNMAGGIVITVNGQTVTLQGKEEFLVVDALDAISFDLTSGGGRSLVVEKNHQPAEFATVLLDGDIISFYWKN